MTRTKFNPLQLVAAVVLSFSFAASAAYYTTAANINAGATFAYDPVFDPVCSVWAKLANGEWVCGTGVLAEKQNKVTTAAHMLKNAVEIKVAFGRNALTPDLTLGVASYNWDARWSGSAGTGYDIGVITLSSLVDVTPAHLYTGTQETGLACISAGFGAPGSIETGFMYGFDENGYPTSDYVMRAGGNYIVAYGDQSYYSTQSCHQYLIQELNRSISPTYQTLERYPSNHDSGGPDFVWNGLANQWQVISLMSAGDYEPDYGSWSQSQSILQSMDYLETQGVPEPATLCLLGMGAAWVLRRKRSA